MALKKKKTAENVIKSELVEKKGLCGVVVAWDLAPMRSGGYDMGDVEQSLDDCDLPKDCLPNLADENYFIRAARSAQEAGALKYVKRAGDEIVFQFIAVDDNEDPELIQFVKNAIIVWNKKDQKMRCKNKKVLQYVTERFEVFANNYTTSDITKTLVKLFKKHAEMLPLREHGGAYFVPIQLIDFVVKVEKLLKSICPRNMLTLIEVPDREVSKMQVQESLTNEIEKFKGSLQREIADLQESGADGFSKMKHANRIGEVQAMSKRVQMYAEWLRYEADEQLALVESANKIVVDFLSPDASPAKAPPKKSEGTTEKKLSLKERLKLKKKKFLKRRKK